MSASAYLWVEKQKLEECGESARGRGAAAARDAATCEAAARAAARPAPATPRPPEAAPAGTGHTAGTAREVPSMMLVPAASPVCPARTLPLAVVLKRKDGRERGDNYGMEERQRGVLLYYAYRDLGEHLRAEIVTFFQGVACDNLVGRIRVALDGVSCTLGGAADDLRHHVKLVEAHPVLGTGVIAFNMSQSCGARNGIARREAKFEGLSVAAVREVVTLGVAPERAPLALAGQHMAPEDFHRLLIQAGAASTVAPEVTAAAAAGATVGAAAAVMAAAAAAVMGAAPTPAPDLGTTEDGAGRNDGGASGNSVGVSGSSGCSDICAGDDRERRNAGSRSLRACDRAGSSTDAASARNDDGGCRSPDKSGSSRDRSGSTVPNNRCGSGSSWTAETKTETETVLLDARNVYESAIGRFCGIPGVELLEPRTRQFSDLPRWIDDNAERLRGRRVLMYCTGGVRCERASAYLRSKGDGFLDVRQLSGGIESYMAAFPAGSGGLFRGKNFVFDERVAVAPPSADESATAAVEAVTAATVVGNCAGCGAPWDDYGARCRCPRCRILVLVCDACLRRPAAPTDDGVSRSGDAEATATAAAGAATDAAAAAGAAAGTADFSAAADAGAAAAATAGAAADTTAAAAAAAAAGTAAAPICQECRSRAQKHVAAPPRPAPRQNRRRCRQDGGGGGDDGDGKGGTSDGAAAVCGCSSGDGCSCSRNDYRRRNGGCSSGGNDGGGSSRRGSVPSGLAG